MLKGRKLFQTKRLSGRISRFPIFASATCRITGKAIFTIGGTAMNKDLFISGSIVVTRDEDQRVKFIQFVPDDEFTPVLEHGSKTSGQLQLLRNAAFDYVASKPRIRNNLLLIRKARHGRLSGTRDHAFQLTLKVFAAEGIDWQKAFVEEPIEVMADLMGLKRMREILKEALKKLEAQGLVEKDWKPYGQEW